MMTYCKGEVRLDADILSLPDKSSGADLVRSINSNVMFIKNLVIFKLQKNFQDQENKDNCKTRGFAFS